MWPQTPGGLPPSLTVIGTPDTPIQTPGGPSTIPEPATWLMLMMGGFVMLGWSSYHHGKRGRVEK